MQVLLELCACDRVTRALHVLAETIDDALWFDQPAVKAQAEVEQIASLAGSRFNLE